MFKGLKKAIVNITAMAGIIAACILGGCKKSEANAAQAQPGVPVVTAKAQVKPVPVEVSNFGTVEAYASVGVKTQVPAVLEKAHFIEGQLVKKGDLLLSLDDRQYAATLNMAKANLEKDQAQLVSAQKEAQRQTELLHKGVTSQDEFDRAKANAEMLAAAINADKAAIENARLKVEYCSIKSPIDGVVGALLIHPGNVVKENDAVVVTINQVKPIYVNFSLPQQFLGQIRPKMEAGTFKVLAKIPGEQNFAAQGKLWFVDNNIDVQTGTIKLKAVFDNNETKLWPGQFVNVSLVLSVQDNALIVPAPAVQTSQQGQFVFVVKPDMTVESRAVSVNRTVEGQSVIDSGLSADETLVVDGQLRLVPGAKVDISRPTAQAKETGKK